MSEAGWLWIEYTDNSSGNATRDLCHAYMLAASRLLYEGKIERAIEYANEALRLARSIADQMSEWAALGSLGNIDYETGHWTSARDYYTQALSIVQTLGHRRGEGYLSYNLSLVYHRLGEHQQAIHMAQRAFDLLSALNDEHVQEIHAQLHHWMATYQANP